MYHSFRPFLVASALLGLTTVAACHKAQVGPTDTQASRLVGRWQLTQTSGGIAGQTQPADPQQLREIVFGADGQAQDLLNGTPIATSTYTLVQAVSATTQRTETFISFAGPCMNGRSYISELSATTLALSDDNPDGLGVRYQRVMPLLCGTP